MAAGNGHLSFSPGDVSPGDVSPGDASPRDASQVDARRRGLRSAFLPGSLAAFTVVSGVMGLHALFGSFLSLLVAVAFFRRVKHGPPMQTGELRNFSCGLSRLVYLLLYLVFGAMLLANLPALPTRDLRATLGYGIAALVMIRVLEAWLRRCWLP